MYLKIRVFFLLFRSSPPTYFYKVKIGGGSSVSVTLLIRGCLFLRWRRQSSYSLAGKTDQFRISRLQERTISYNFELIHDQLPLAVPCYDLALVTKFTLVPHKVELWVPSAPLA